MVWLLEPEQRPAAIGLGRDAGVQTSVFVSLYFATLLTATRQGQPGAGVSLPSYLSAELAPAPGDIVSICPGDAVAAASYFEGCCCLWPASLGNAPNDVA